MTPRALAFALLLLLATMPLEAQPVSTHCATIEVPIDGTTTDLRLVGCGEEFEQNVLWHLDRADSVSGVLDGVVHRPGTGKGVVVYVYDSGIRADHDEFTRPAGSNVIGAVDLPPEWPPYTCINGTPTALDPCRDTTSLGAFWIYTHGTATASVIAGRNTGVAPDAALISVAAVRTSESPAIEALDAIIRHAWEPSTPPFRTAIVNMSALPAPPDTPLAAAMEAKMRDMIFGVDGQGRRDPAGKKFLFVSIAGNYAPGPATAALHGHCDAERRVALFPATRGSAIDGLIIVGGITPENDLWDRSCVGDSVDILAPASQMLVASITGRDHYRSGKIVAGARANEGTSYAAPYVAGLAALLLEKNPSLSPEEIEQILKARSSRVDDSGETIAGGRVAIFDRSPAGRRRAVSR